MRVYAVAKRITNKLYLYLHGEDPNVSHLHPSMLTTFTGISGLRLIIPKTAMLATPKNVLTGARNNNRSVGLSVPEVSRVVMTWK